MRGLFLSQLRMEDPSFGTVKKVLDEIHTFEKAGMEMDHINSRDVTTGIRSNRFIKGILASLPFVYIYSKFNYTEEIDGYDFYYFRFEVSDYHYTRFLKLIRKNNPRALIVIEFPDFPYIQVWKGMIFSAIRLKDYIARLKYKKYVDRFAVWNPEYMEVYGVKALHYKNGIDVGRIPVRKPENKYSPDDEIHMVCVCTMFPFHGQDRLIKGMGEYYRDNSNRRVYLHLIGDGPGLELPKYKKLAAEWGIEDYVLFEGKKVKEELDPYFDSCDLAVGSLGLYRLGIECAGSLKIREYLARGIPVVIGGPADIVDGSFEYCLQLSNSDENISVRDIIGFYDRIYGLADKEDIAAKIREYAVRKCDYSETMKEIITFLNGEGSSCYEG